MNQSLLLRRATRPGQRCEHEVNPSESRNANHEYDFHHLSSSNAERYPIHFRGRADCRRAGPYRCIHYLWGWSAARDRRRVAWKGCVAGWARRIRPGDCAALFHRLLRGGDLLRGKPQAGIHGAASSSVRSFLRRCDLSGDESHRASAFGPAPQGPIPAGILDSRTADPHVSDWSAHRIKRTPIRAYFTWIESSTGPIALICYATQCVSRGSSRFVSI